MLEAAAKELTEFAKKNSLLESTVQALICDEYMTVDSLIYLDSAAIKNLKLSPGQQRSLQGAVNVLKAGKASPQNAGDPPAPTPVIPIPEASQDPVTLDSIPKLDAKTMESFIQSLREKPTTTNEDPWLTGRTPGNSKPLFVQDFCSSFLGSQCTESVITSNGDTKIVLTNTNSRISPEQTTWQQ